MKNLRRKSAAIYRLRYETLSLGIKIEKLRIGETLDGCVPTDSDACTHPPFVIERPMENLVDLDPKFAIRAANCASRADATRIARTEVQRGDRTAAFCPAAT